MPVANPASLPSARAVSVRAPFERALPGRARSRVSASSVVGPRRPSPVVRTSLRGLVMRLMLPLALLAGCAAPPPVVPSHPPAPEGAVLLGEGEHTYAWVPDWLSVPGGGDLGSTHGEIVVAQDGRIYLSTDTELAVMVFRPDGSFVRSWGGEFANGLHGMTIHEEDGRELLYFPHFNRHEVVKATLDGSIVWRRGAPAESGVYDDPSEFRPTSVAVAPDGRVYVADGYGKGYVHVLDADGHWLSTFGGPGKEPGRFQTPHGIAIDTRQAPPTVLVADRENHRLQRFDLDGHFLNVIEGMLRRPCKISLQGEDLVVPDLEGRVTILDGHDALVTQLGDNSDPSLRASYGVPREQWRDGEFIAPHSACWDADGNLYVMDWNAFGRVNKLLRVAPPQPQASAAD